MSHTLNSTGCGPTLTMLDDIYRPGAPWLDLNYLPRDQRFALVKILHPLSQDLVEQGVAMLRLVERTEAIGTYLATTAAEALWACGKPVTAQSLARTIQGQFDTIDLVELRPSLGDRIIRIRTHNREHFAKLATRCVAALNAQADCELAPA